MAATAALRQGGGGALQDGRRGSGHGRGVRDEDDAGRGGTGQQPWVPAPPPEIAAEPPRQHELRDDQAGVDQLRYLAGELRLANWPAWATRWRPHWCGRSSRTGHRPDADRRALAPHKLTEAYLEAVKGGATPMPGRRGVFHRADVHDVDLGNGVVIPVLPPSARVVE
jgi:hypothetical protein